MRYVYAHAAARSANISVTAALISLAGCGLDLDPVPAVIHARFDPEAKVVPMPNDALRDASAKRLAIPIDDQLTSAERALYERLNEMDGWSTAMAATVSFDGPIARATVTPETVQVWSWGTTPRRVDDVTITIADDEMSLTIDAPRTGWERGGRYGVVLRGGPAGIEGKAGEPVECDAAFHFLRLTERLDVPEHERAFPGDTADERRDKARKLEAIRTDLEPVFEHVAARGIPRSEVAALWSFTVTRRVELAMDKASQRVPLPLDILRDPQSGRVDLPPAPWDSEIVVRAKTKLRAYDGFGTSSLMLFQFTGPVDQATVARSVELWRADGPKGPERLSAEVALLADKTTVEVTPSTLPLAEKARYAIVVRDSIRDEGGAPIALMPLGHLLTARAEVAVDGKSRIGSLADADARRVEQVRPDVVAFLDALGDRARGVAAAWTFTTMTVSPHMDRWIDQPSLLAVPVEPKVARRQSSVEALLEFPLAINSLWNVKEVVHGDIASPVFLDKLTRGFREDGGHTVERVAFTALVPRSPKPGPLPVVIFGHGIMTERRFVLAIGDALTSRGFAAVSIDLPFHGTRTYCWFEGPLTIPDPTTGKVTPLAPPCPDNATCEADGRCTLGGKTVPFRTWPVITMPVASGAAFIEVDNPANIRDHFVQSEIDLSSLLRSLREGDWSEVLGRDVDPKRVYYVGQSLGGILGATFVAQHPEIDRAVLNVPGADSVDLFTNSPTFGPQVAAFYKRQMIDPASYEGHRFLNVARWFMDSADPASFAGHLVTRSGQPPRSVLLQMATQDTIIPNEYTLKLQALSGAPRRDYRGSHAFLAIPIEQPANANGINDLAKFLSGELVP